MKKILIVMGRYLPGYKDGGPVRSIKNLTDYLGEEYEFRILTCDRDHGDERPYMGIKTYDWNTVGNAKVYYVEPGHFKLNIIVKLSNEVDVVYVCGCFNDYAINTLLAKRLGKIKVPVVVAAMGLFSPLAFKIKYAKKKIFVSLLSIMGMYDNIFWSATSENEICEIKEQIKTKNEMFYIAEDLPRKISDDNYCHRNKEKNNLDIVWISRICKKKNLSYAIEVLKEVKSQVKFTIYGIKEDVDYWKECEKLLTELPSNVVWRYEGPVDSDRVISVMKKHEVLLFPTLGENYGHVIQEALSTGCVCLLSDQTPWKDLGQLNIGDVINLNEKDRFVTKIEEYATLNSDEYNEISYRAFRYAIDKASQSIQNTGYRRIFEIN